MAADGRPHPPSSPSLPHAKPDPAPKPPGTQASHLPKTFVGTLWAGSENTPRCGTSPPPPLRSARPGTPPAPDKGSARSPAPRSLAHSLTHHQELASATGEVQLQRRAAASASLGPVMVGCGRRRRWGSPRGGGRRHGAPCGGGGGEEEEALSPTAGSACGGARSARPPAPAHPTDPPPAAPPPPPKAAGSPLHPRPRPPRRPSPGASELSLKRPPPRPSAGGPPVPPGRAGALSPAAAGVREPSGRFKAPRSPRRLCNAGAGSETLPSSPPPRNRLQTQPWAGRGSAALRVGPAPAPGGFMGRRRGAGSGVGERCESSKGSPVPTARLGQPGSEPPSTPAESTRTHAGTTK